MALYNYLKGGFNKVVASLFSQVTSDSMKGNGLELYQGRVKLDIRKNFFTKGLSSTETGWEWLNHHSWRYLKDMKM